MAVISTTVAVPAGVTSSGEIVISGGHLTVDGGGAIVGTIDTQAGETIISAGGTATGTTVQGNLGSTTTGGQIVEGVAISTLVASGGFEAVAFGGVTSGALVLKGGIEDVAVSGNAVGMTVNGGSAVVSSGGTASGTTVTNGGVLTVSSGGTVSDVSDSGGRFTVAPVSVGNGGTMNVGGKATNVLVTSGGTLIVSSGGVVDQSRFFYTNEPPVTIQDPNDPNVAAQVTVLSGGASYGNIEIDGGILTLDPGAYVGGMAIVHEGWLLLEHDSFGGIITDFGRSATLDLAKIRFIGQGPDATTATFTHDTVASPAHPHDNGGLLQVAQGSHVVDFHVLGTYTTANFALASDGAHGTLVTFVP